MASDGMSTIENVDTINLDKIEDQQTLKDITSIVEDLFNERRTLKPVDQNVGSPMMQQEIAPDDRIINDIFKLAKTKQESVKSSVRYPDASDDAISATGYGEVGAKLSGTTPAASFDIEKTHASVNPVDNMVSNLLGFWKPEQVLKLLNAYTKVVPEKK